ncbi:hypothetical protein MNBD_ACTINO01-1697 [hydrothermal vent metagenome]|uniref:Uncharacterized protein n=1 Tax=hydrothermal vent metagenome TaxID=652676 RepID=A0A3B0RAD8_9ZZZZ
MTRAADIPLWVKIVAVTIVALLAIAVIGGMFLY